MAGRVTIIVATLIFAGLAACSSIDVQTDYDQSTDFSRFQTFAFAGMTDMTESGVLNNSLTRKRLESAIAGEMSKKGLKQVDKGQNPDLLVHYWTGVKDKQVVEGTAPEGSAYGWRGAYGGYVYGTGYSGVTTLEYREGTLITDLIEPEKNELVWRARMVSALKDTSAENFKLAKEAIAEAFEQYPPPSAP